MEYLIILRRYVGIQSYKTKGPPNSNQIKTSNGLLATKFLNTYSFQFLIAPSNANRTHLKYNKSLPILINVTWKNESKFTNTMPYQNLTTNNVYAKLKLELVQ